MPLCAFPERVSLVTVGQWPQPIAIYELELAVSTDCTGGPDLQFSVESELVCESIHCMLHGPDPCCNKGDKTGRYSCFRCTVHRNAVHHGQHKFRLDNRSRSSSKVFELDDDLYKYVRVHVNVAQRHRTGPGIRPHQPRQRPCVAC